MNLGTSMLLRALDNSLHAFDVQSANLFLARVVAQENPLFGLDEPPRRQNNPTIVVADSSEIASRDTQCGECTDKRRSVVVVDNAAQVLRRLPSRKAAFEQCEQPPCQYEVQKKTSDRLPLWAMRRCGLSIIIPRNELGNASTSAFRSIGTPWRASRTSDWPITC